MHTQAKAAGDIGTGRNRPAKNACADGVPARGGRLGRCGSGGRLTAFPLFLLTLTLQFRHEGRKLALCLFFLRTDCLDLFLMAVDIVLKRADQLGRLVDIGLQLLLLGWTFSYSFLTFSVFFRAAL